MSTINRQLFHMDCKGAGVGLVPSIYVGRPFIAGLWLLNCRLLISVIFIFPISPYQHLAMKQELLIF